MIVCEANALRSYVEQNVKGKNHKDYFTFKIQKKKTFIMDNSNEQKEKSETVQIDI